MEPATEVETETQPEETQPEQELTETNGQKEEIAEAEQGGEQEQAGEMGEAGEAGEEEMDAEIEAIKKRFKEMEEEVVKIEALQTSVEKSMKPGIPVSTPAQDERSIYVGNVDYSTTNEELQAFFASCGPVVRVTILNDKWSGPKGYAYVEFKEPESVLNAMILNETPFKSRPLKISPKRTNVPSFMRGRGGGRPGDRRPPAAEGLFPPSRPYRPSSYGYAPRRPFRARRGYHPYF